MFAVRSKGSGRGGGAVEKLHSAIVPARVYNTQIIAIHRDRKTPEKCEGLVSLRSRRTDLRGIRFSVC